MTGQRALTGLAVIAIMLVSLSPAFAGTANYSYDDVDRLDLTHTIYSSGVSNSADYGYDDVDNMTSRAVDTPDISVSPSSHDFGNVTEGQSSTPQTITITNNGTSSLTIGTIAIKGTNTTDFSTQNDNCSNQTVPSSGNCTLDVVFSPTSGEGRSAWLSVPSDDSIMPTLEVPLSGYGVPYYALGVILAGSGFGNVTSSPAGIDCGNGLYIGTDCSEAYLVGTEVTLTATPDPDSVFTNWSGGGCSGTGQCTVTMERITSVTATYTALYDLNVTIQGSGFGNVTSAPAGIECGSGTVNDCTEKYLDGTEVTLNATPDSGDVFAGWSGGGCSGTGPCTVTMGADTNVTATFASYFNLSVILNGNGFGNVVSSSGTAGGIDQYTVLMLHNDGPDGATTFTDDSDSGHTVTANPDAQVDTDIADAFGGTDGSAMFDGSGDYLWASDSDDWNFGSGDFTIDFWTRFNSFKPNFNSLMSQLGGGWWQLHYRHDTKVLWFTTDIANPLIQKSWTPALDTWYHIALVRSGNIFTFYVDGTSIGSQTNSSAIKDLSDVLTIGADGLAERDFDGWIDEIRISKGIARWTSDFVPFTEPYETDIQCGSGTINDCSEDYVDGTQVTLTATPDSGDGFAGWSGGGCSGTGDCTVTITTDTVVTATFDQGYTLDVSVQGTGLGNVVSYGESDQYAVLMLHNDGPDGATTFVDDSITGHTVSVNGNVQVDAAQSQFGGASALFDGAGDYLWASDSDDWNFGSDDFTIDLWVRFATLPVDNYYVLMKQRQDGSNLMFFYWENRDDQLNRGLRFNFNIGGTWYQVVQEHINSASGWSANMWYHIAVVRNGSNWYLFRNGTQIATGSDGVAYSDYAAILTIGGGTTSAYLDGWIDEIRISKGIARWTSNFTPPSEPYYMGMGIECGSGTINDCSEDYADGTQVKLLATTETGSVFTGWSGGGCNGTGQCILTVTSDTAVTATFEPTHNLSVDIQGTGAGSVESSPPGVSCGSGTPNDCDELFAASTEVTLTATPDTGSYFDGWSGGGCSGTGDCVVTMDADKTVTASFSPAPAIDVNPSSHSYGSLARGDSATKTFTTSNLGNEDLVLGNLTITGVDASDFTLVTDNCSGQTLIPTQSCTFDIGFSPNAVGSLTANAEIPSNDPYTPTYYVSLSGIGGNVPNIKVNSALIEEGFSSGIPASWTASGVWSGSNPCGRVIGSPFIEPWAIADSQCQAASIDELLTPIFDASSCSDVDLLFSNQFDWYDSSSRATVAVSNDGGQIWSDAEVMNADDGYPTPNWKEIDVGGLAGAAEAQIKYKYESTASDGFWAIDNVWTLCKPAELNFEGFFNEATPPETVMVYNRGFDNLSIGTVAITGADASYFAIQYDECSGQVLAPDSSCTIDVVFTPADVVVRTASLDIPSNDPDTPTANVPLNGEIGNILDVALYVEDLKPGTDPENSSPSISDVTNYMVDDATDPGVGFSVQKVAGKSDVMSLRADTEASQLSQAILHIYARYVSSGQQNVDIYAYQLDSDSLNTSTSLSFTIVPGWNNLEVTQLLSLMDGFGFIKFRMVNAGANITVSEAKIAIKETTGAPNQPPVADAGPDQSVGVRQDVTFDGTGSYDPDGTIVSYDWDFGDNKTGSDAVVTHNYKKAGEYTVTLTVTDDQEATDQDTAVVTVQ